MASIETYNIDMCYFFVASIVPDKLDLKLAHSITIIDMLQVCHFQNSVPFVSVRRSEDGTHRHGLWGGGHTEGMTGMNRGCKVQ